MSGEARCSLNGLTEARARRMFSMILAICLGGAFISKAIGQTESIESIFHGGQVGNFVLYEGQDGKPVGEYSATGRTFFFLEGGTVINDENSARNMFLHAAAEQDFIRDHNLTAIPPLLNFIRYTGEDSLRDTDLPAIETLSDLECTWPFQIIIMFKGEHNSGRGYSFFALRSHNEKLEIGCSGMQATSVVETKLQPSLVSIYPDPTIKSSFYVISNSAPCIRHFTSSGRLTRTCKNDLLFVADASYVEEAFEKLASGTLSPSAAINLIESKIRPITSLMMPARNPKE